jgi:hypothetical protein
LLQKYADGLITTSKPDNVEISKKEMQDYLEYMRNSVTYKSTAIETTVEFTPYVKDAVK